jgi:hypothetical protein
MFSPRNKIKEAVQFTEECLYLIRMKERAGQENSIQEIERMFQTIINTLET